MSKYRKFYIGVFLLPQILFFLLAASFLSPPLEAAPSEKTVRVGYFLWDGYHNLSQSGYRSGYGYEYLHEIAKYSGWKYEYVIGSWEECLQMLEEGKIDLLTSAYYNEKKAQLFDYSALPIGTNFTILTGRADDTRFDPNDYAAMNNLRIGILRGDSRIGEMENFSRAHHFSYRSIYLGSESDLTDALATNKIDAILSDGLRRTRNEKILLRFAPLPFYCIVRKGNAALLQELNAAIEALKTDNPQIDALLYSKYYGQTIQGAVALTAKETAYFRTKKYITAVAAPDRDPLSYFENGRYKGIIADIMKIVGDNLGIEIRYMETASYREALQKVRDGEADILCNFFTDYDWAEKNGVAITSPYLDMQYSAVMLRGAATQHPTIAAADEYFFNQALLENQFNLNPFTAAIGDNYFFNQVFIESSFAPENIFHYETEEDCLRAVENGRQNLTFLNTYIAEKLLRKSRYSNLAAFLVPNFRHSISIALAPNADPLLRSGLNKSVLRLNKSITSGIVAKHTMFHAGQITLSDYVHQNPFPVICGIAVLFSCIVAALLYALLARKKYMRSIYELAYFDAFTGLWNTAKFEQEAQRAIQTNRRQSYAVISFDINRFDVINDSYGRNVGDQIIQFAATELRALEMTAARVKADHFLLLLPYRGEAEIAAFAARLAERLQHYEANALHILLKLNIGIYRLSPNETTAITAAIDAAETARKEAKNRKDLFVYFDRAMENRLVNAKEIEDKMLRAMKEKQFQVYYQPKYDMRNHTIIGAEALIRWRDPERGLLSPAEFVPIFEQNGFIIEIDFFVLEEVCKLIAAWVAAGRTPRQISVNQSRIHLNEEHYIERLSALLERYQIPPRVIELELTETSVVDEAKAPVLIKRLHELGFLLSIDDFGSGYSSITLLNALPLDVMKIDKELLCESGGSERTRKIVKKIVEMGLELDMQVICEGVEEERQAAFLLSIGCNYAQGFLYAKPLCQEEFLARLNEENDH